METLIAVDIDITNGEIHSSIIEEDINSTETPVIMEDISNTETPVIMEDINSTKTLIIMDIPDMEVDIMEVTNIPSHVTYLKICVEHIKEMVMEIMANVKQDADIILQGFVMHTIGMEIVLETSVVVDGAE